MCECAVLFPRRCDVVDPLEGLRAQQACVQGSWPDRRPLVLCCCHFKQSLAEEWASISPLSSAALKGQACCDRAEPRKRRANWKIILVWVPEMSAALVIPASPLELLSAIITFSGRRCRSGRSPAHSGNFPSWRLIDGDLKGPGVPYYHRIIMGCSWRQTGAHNWLLHSLKGNVGKGFVSVQIPGLTLGLTHDRGGKKSLSLQDWVFRKGREGRFCSVPAAGTLKGFIWLWSICFKFCLFSAFFLRTMLTG